jgi:hypothetical protein
MRPVGRFFFNPLKPYCFCQHSTSLFGKQSLFRVSIFDFLSNGGKTSAVLGLRLTFARIAGAAESFSRLTALIGLRPAFQGGACLRAGPGLLCGAPKGRKPDRRRRKPVSCHSAPSCCFGEDRTAPRLKSGETKRTPGNAFPSLSFEYHPRLKTAHAKNSVFSPRLKARPRIPGPDPPPPHPF